MDDALNTGKSVINFLDVHPWILITLIAHGAILGAVAYLILLERKIASWVQDRIGPNRVGLGFGIIPWLKDKKMMGLGQPLADGVKFILKEDYRPKGADKWLFSAAPMMMIVVVIVSIAVLPWGGIKQTTRDIDVASWVGNDKPADLDTTLPQRVQSQLPIDATKLSETDRVEDRQDSNGVWQRHLIANVTYRYNFQTCSLNIGVLFVLAALSLAVYGVVIGGWASNNKYSFLGGLRATANMISYEIPLGLAVLCVVIVFGTLNLEEIVNKQAFNYHLGSIPIPAWNIWSQPYAFILFLVCIHAEANRAPFDMAEAEQELVGGYHTEYSAMRFALFFLGEYAGMITTSVVCVALFFGGWHFPGVDRGVVWIVNAITHSGAWVDGPVTNSLVVCIVRSLVIFTKTIGIIFIFMWVRWSLPRFRFDQLMNLAWRGLIPISLALLMTTAIVVYYAGGAPGDETLSPETAGWLALANIVLLIVSIVVGALLPSTDTNRKIHVPNSRYATTPLPAGTMPVSDN